MDKSDLVKFRSECIAAHNFYRSLHGTTPLVWSAKLADGAQKWAEQLASADSLTYSQERGIGENIACLWGSDVTGNKVTQIWYEESQNYDYSAPRVTPSNRPFCQVVWEGTRELGAGKAATKNGKQVVVARYHPPASRKQVEKNVKSPKLDRIHGTTALATRASVGLRKFQEECLFAHNEFRVLHGAPPLHWSPSLAWAAQQWAEELVQIGELKHNNDELIGENLAGMVGDELTGKECTDMWYEEVNDFDFENPCYSEETSNFTQVVWIGSELFGVGRATLKDTCIVVAFYEPPGNIEGLFGANVRLQGTRVKTYRLTKEMKTFIPPSPDLDWFRIECLVAHNYLRARHGAPPLVIGQALNEEAQYWAERLLVTGATEDLQESRIGINVAVIHGHHIGGLKVAELWYDEGADYNFESPGFSLSTRSFTQLIWLSSRKLGIGKASNNSGQCVIVARYEPVGNIDGLFVANVRRRGHERNSLEPMLFESDVKYRFKIEGRRSFRMSWEVEGTQTLQALDKTREKTRLVWIESPVLPRKQMRESCDLEREKSDEDKESGVEVEEGEDFDQEGTEPEPEEGRVHARVAYFEHFEKIEKEKLDRPKRSSTELKEQLRQDQYEVGETKGHKIREHEETVCQLEYDDVFPKHDENDERDDDFGSEGEAEEDDDDVMSLETVSEAEEDLLEELEEYTMDHHIKSYCYEENYPREEDEKNVTEDQADERDQIAEIIETELDKMDKEQASQDPDHCVASTVDRDQMRVVDTHIEFIPIEVEKRKEFNPDDIKFEETKEEKELFNYEIKTPEKEQPSRPFCTERVDSEAHDRVECQLNVDEMFSKLEKPEKPKGKPPPTLPKPKRKLIEEVPAASRTEIRTVKTTETVETVCPTKPDIEPVWVHQTVKTSTRVIEEKPIESKPAEAVKTVETVHRTRTEPEPVWVKKEETVETSRQVIEQKATEQRPVEIESKEQPEEEEEVSGGSEEEDFEVFDVSFIDRERKMNNILKRLGRRIELLPAAETKTTPREFDRNIDLSDTREEEELFRVFEAPAVRKTWDKSPVQEETIFAEHRKKDVESEVEFEEMFERLEKGEELPAKTSVKEPSRDIVLESERLEEEPQDEKSKVVRFEKTVVIQDHELVHKDLVELKEEGREPEDYEDVQEESSEDVEDHGEEYDEEEEVESYGQDEEVRTSVSPMDKEETPVQFSQELSEHGDSYGTCEVDTLESRNSVADVYEEYEPPPGTQISETSCSRSIHLAADVENKPLESGVEEKSVRTTMYDSFEEVLPEASASPVIEPSTCCVAAEINHRVSEVVPVEQEAEVAALSSDDEPESVDKVAVRGIPQTTESTVCITTETTYHQRTEIVQKRAPSIEMEIPIEKEESMEEEASYKDILTNGHCTPVRISHNIDETKTEVITETESYETESPQALEEDKVAVSEVRSEHEDLSVQLQEEEEKEKETVEEEEEEQVEKTAPVAEDVQEQVEEQEEEQVGTVEEEEDKQVEKAAPVAEDVEEQIEEQEEEKEEIVEEEEEVEKAAPVAEDVEEQVEDQEEEKEKETVEEEEEEEQVEKATPVAEDVQEQVEEQEEKNEEIVEEEEEQIEKAAPVAEYVQEQVEEQEEIVEEEEEVEKAAPVAEDVEEQFEEQDEEKEEIVEEEEEEVEKAAPVAEDVQEQVEEQEEEKEKGEIVEEEEEQAEKAASVSEDVQEQVEEQEEEKEEIVEEKGEEQVEKGAPVAEDVQEQVEEQEEEKEEVVEEEEEQVKKVPPVTEDVEETVEEKEEGKEEEDVGEQPEEKQGEQVEETIEEEKEEKQEIELEFPDGTEDKDTEEPEQVEETDTQQVVEVENSQSLVVDDRFEYISEEELEETDELYEALRESVEEQENEELIEEENVHIQQTAAGILQIGSQEEDEENFEQFAEEASEDEMSYDSEVITEVEKEITSALVVKESFSSAVCDDESASENVDIEERETESPGEETQAETLLQFSQPIEEDVPDNVDEREPVVSHDDNDEVFMTEEQMEPPETPQLEECEELESSDEVIDKKVELIQFTEETTGEEKVTPEEDVYEEEKAASESEERLSTPDQEEGEEEEGDELESSGEFAEENVEMIQFNEQEDEDKVVEEGSEVDEPYPLSPDVIEEKQIVTESGVELIQFTEQAEERVEEDHPVESPELELEESEEHKEEEVTDEKTELIQFVEQREAEEVLEEYVAEDSGKLEVEEELVISQPIACSTPIFLGEEESHQESTSFEDSAEAGFGEEYEDMEKIVAHDHSLDATEPISLEESSELSNEFYKAEADETASKAVAEEFDDSSRIEDEQQRFQKAEGEQTQTSVTSTSVITTTTTTVYEKRIITTKDTESEVADFNPLESDEEMEHEEHSEDHFSPPPTITATEFVADEEEEGSEEEYIPNFEHPRTYMMENKEVVMDRNAVESKVEEKEEVPSLEESEKEEHEDEIQALSEMETATEPEVVESEPEKVEESETTTVVVSHRSEIVRKQDSDVDDLEEKELEERIQRRQKAMEEKLLQDEIKEDSPNDKAAESEESRKELFFTSISVVKVEHEDDEQRIFREEEATMKMMEDEQKLAEEESSAEELNVTEDEALTEAAFRAEREEVEHKADEPDRGQKEDDMARVPFIPMMAASEVAYRTSKSEREIHEDVDYEEEVEVERIQSSYTEEEKLETHPVLLTDVDFTEEIEVEKVEEEPEEKEDGGEDVYEEELEVQRVDNQEQRSEEECHDDAVFEEEVVVERIQEEHEEEQESFPDAATLPVYEEELDVAAQQVQPQQPQPPPNAVAQNVVQAEQVQEDGRIEEERQEEQESSPDAAPLPVYEEELDVAADQGPQQQPDAEQENIVQAEPVIEDAHENNEVEQLEEQAWEEYEEMEEQDQEIPQEIQGIADQTDMHLYDNNNNESLPRYYVDFSPGGSFEHESVTSDDGDGPEVYRQGEPMEEDMEEFILVKYEDQSSSSGEDVSDHREMYVIHEEDTEDRTDEKKEATEAGSEEKVAYDQGFVNPALEDIREEEEEEKQKLQQEGECEDDFEEKRQLEEYERLESFVILEEKLSQVESDESVEELTSGTDGKRASSEETLNDDDDDEDKLSETRTSSTLKDETTGSKDDESGDETSSPDTQEPSAMDTTLTKEVQEETIDLEDGGVLTKRIVREEHYSIDEDDGDDDDKDKTLTRKKVSKKVITSTSTSETHVRRIEGEPESDNEREPQEEHAEDVATTDTTEQPGKPSSEDEESSKEMEESPESMTKTIETEETIDLDDGGVVKKFVTREETYTVEEGNDDNDDQDSSITRKTVTKKVVTTTTTSTSRVTQLDDEPSSSFSDDDGGRVVESSSEETQTTVIKSRQPEESLATAKRQLSLESSGVSEASCCKRRGCIERFDSHDSEGNTSEVSSTTDSTGDSTSMSSEDHGSDEDYSGLDEFQIDCIRQHNIYRHRHRACRLVWSEDLASAALEWANHLAATKTLEHSPQRECGENLACAKGYDLRGDKVADMWYDEINDYNFETPAFNAKCGHFTQIIWRGTKEFGVAKTIADDGCQYVVARYNPPGNVLGEFKDSIRRARGQRSSVRKRRRSSARRQLSQSSDMSDVLQREKFKNECVISHNYYRSLHGAPPLQWSTALANEAQSFAEKLTKSGSFMHSGSKEIGECLAFSFGLDLSGRDAVDTWYDEIVDYDYEYPGYTSHTANFTQVVWAASKEFGMGKAVGEDGSCVVVGKYYPPGNIVGDFQENVKQKGAGYY